MTPTEQLRQLVESIGWQVAAGVLTTLLVTLALWLWLAHSARRARHHFHDLLERAQHSLDAPIELADAQRRLTALRLVVNAAKYGLAIAALLLIVGQLTGNSASILLPAGFLGAALGLGGQNLVRDLVAGLFIVFEGQFSVGDVVSINGVLGTVEEVGLRVTRLRDDAGQLHFFPNGAINTVAKYPRRHVPLALFCTLAEAAQRDAAQTTALEAVAAFDNAYHALSAPATPLGNPRAAASWVQLTLPVHPSRLAAVREKLPARVTAALQAVQIELAPGTEVEIISVPVV